MKKNRRIKENNVLYKNLLEIVKIVGELPLNLSLTTCVPRYVRNRYERSNEVIKGPRHNDTIIDIVVGHHYHGSNSNT